MPRISLTGVYIASYLVIPTSVVRRCLYTHDVISIRVFDVCYTIYNGVFYPICFISAAMCIGALSIQCRSRNRKTINNNIFPVQRTDILLHIYHVYTALLSYYFLTVSYMYFTSRWRLSNRFLDYKIQLYTKIIIYCILF